MRDLARRLVAWTRLRARDAELAEELEHHRSLLQSHFEATGLAPHDAETQSRRAMGNVTLAREDAREAWGTRWLEQAGRDVRHGMRRLRHEPTFAIAAIVTLALGVTATTTVFSVADAQLWRPLPFPHPERLVALYSRPPAVGAPVNGISGTELRQWRLETAAIFTELAVQVRTARQVLQLETAQSVAVSHVSANYLVTLGRTALAGRTFGENDRQVAVLTDRAWQRLFDRDATVVGRSIRLDSLIVPIVGIVRTDNSIGPDPDLFIVLDEPSPRLDDAAEPLFYSVVGRLKADASREQARAQVQAAADRFARTHALLEADRRIVVEDLGEFTSVNNWRLLYFFTGSSLFVLVLSSMSVAALVLARAVRRRAEFAIREALGGGRDAVARQLIVEGLLIAVPGGVLGVVFAFWTTALLASALPADYLARGDHIPLDLRVLSFSAVVTTGAALAFALVPLPLLRRTSATAALRTGTRSGPSPRDGRLRAALLTAQVALTLVLLSGAVIFFKSFAALSGEPLGFDPADLTSLRVTLGGERYNTDAAIRQYSDQLRDAVRVVPGVTNVSVATSSPLGSGPVIFVVREDRARPPAGQAASAIIRSVDPGFFTTLRTPLVRGRHFLQTDTAGSEPVAIVNVTLAGRLFPSGEEPLGKLIEALPGARAPWTRRLGTLRIIGVVSNVKEVGINEVEFSDVYVPFAQTPTSSIELVVRSAVPAAQIATTLTENVARVDRRVPVTIASTFEQRVADVLQGDRFNLLVIVGFAGIALLLTVASVYGTAAYHVQARSKEFSIRLALGARPSALIAGAARHTSRLAGIGAATGLAGTLLIARFLGDSLYLVPGSHTGMLFGVTTTDPTMLTAAVAAVLGIAGLAGLVPARQVARVDPVGALKSD